MRRTHQRNWRRTTIDIRLLLFLAMVEIVLLLTIAAIRAQPGAARASPGGSSEGSFIVSWSSTTHRSRSGAPLGKRNILRNGLEIALMHASLVRYP